MSYLLFREVKGELARQRKRARWLQQEGGAHHYQVAKNMFTVHYIVLRWKIVV